jgi:transcriptional regulator with XRE-family HTH domain
LEKAAEVCFDRDTGTSVSKDHLKSYQETLAQYHLHPEAKFQDGDYADSGITSRRHIAATAIEHIGKEANRWEEQFHLGLDSDAQTEYGTSPEDHERILDVVRQAGKKFGQRMIARAACVSLRDVSALLCGKQEPTPATLKKLYRAIPRLETAYLEKAEHTQNVLNEVKVCCQSSSERWFAARAGVDQADLARILSGRRKPSEAILAKLELTLERFLQDT